ncbi:hypothetical protein FQR65_LT17122 [Abscondita terminalis]|nr:hypothetical protein FQR65_LT17122 [Abscondita terminalis]
MQLSMSGKGNAAPRGGIPGDLIILVEEVAHEQLKRDGINVIYDLYINFADAALGTSVEIPTIDGKAKIKIDPGTQGGKILRLKAKVFLEVNSYHKGDQLIYVNVWTPKAVSSEEKALLEKLRESPNFKPQPGRSEKSFFERIKEYFDIAAGNGVTTGLSAADRVQTIKAASARNAKPEDLARPGHIFPLRAKKGGVLERNGHTEGSIDLMLLAGLEPQAVLCELMNDDVSMARLPQVPSVSQSLHRLTVLSIEEDINFLP